MLCSHSLLSGVCCAPVPSPRPTRPGPSTSTAEQLGNALKSACIKTRLPHMLQTADFMVRLAACMRATFNSFTPGILFCHRDRRIAHRRRFSSSKPVLPLPKVMVHVNETGPTGDYPGRRLTARPGGRNGQGTRDAG